MFDNDFTESISALECADCGESDPAVLEFDHPGDTLDLPGKIVSRGRAFAQRDVYTIVCADCHRQRAAERGLFGLVIRRGQI